MTRMLYGRETPGDAEIRPRFLEMSEYDGDWLVLTWFGWFFALNIWPTQER